jgi:hypothetical protein
VVQYAHHWHQASPPVVLLSDKAHNRSIVDFFIELAEIAAYLLDFELAVNIFRGILRLLAAVKSAYRAFYIRWC